MNVPILLIGGLLIVVATAVVISVIVLLMRSGGESAQPRQRQASNAQPRNVSHPQSSQKTSSPTQQTAIYSDDPYPPPTTDNRQTKIESEASHPSSSSRNSQTAIDPFTADMSDIAENEVDEQAAVDTDIDPSMLKDDDINATLPDEAALADTQIEPTPREELMQRLLADVPVNEFGYVFLSNKLHSLEGGITVIGSDADCDLTVTSDPDIATQHVRLIAINQQGAPTVYAEPLENANDILRNQQAIVNRVQLKPHDTLDLTPKTIMIYTYSKLGE